MSTALESSRRTPDGGGRAAGRLIRVLMTGAAVRSVVRLVGLVCGAGIGGRQDRRKAGELHLSLVPRSSLRGKQLCFRGRQGRRFSSRLARAA